MEKRFFWTITGILIVVVIAAAFAFVYLRINQNFNGSVINPANLAPNFTLTDQTEQLVSLSDFQGKYVLLYFGYTNCTQECPATMAMFKQVRIQLGSTADEVQVLFVSTDPARDTPEAMGNFVNKFDPTFIGLTGKEDELQPVWSAYGVTVENGGETHSSYAYLIDTKGDLRLTYPNLTTPDQITSDIRLLMRGK
jgi:protein SCO1/2